MWNQVSHASHYRALSLSVTIACFIRTGINLDKIDIRRPDLICLKEFDDLTQAGSVYVVVHKPKKEGSSTETDFIATHYDLYVVSSINHTTYVDSVFKIRKWDHYSLIRKVGQIPLINIQIYRMPNRFAQEVEHQLISEVHDRICALNKSDKWSSTLSCQMFTHHCAEYFRFKFPQDIKIISDCMPTMMNLYLNGSLLTNKAIAKSNETSSF
ncbi:unnamed protein product [Didymodactylos carnosus]|uniref:Uncharacterized protein n=1 Tax=Didymodactylos carnosus TaxID=1234261 RepID=A0A815U9R0_9BILA|nr:unnamed protein product [Didymodactylos carnosus]CAF1516571.1 unnamed protein product [Didymodactylos carnosus]CAF3755501.1 unnamed protein product [Didymodactylos carnosus]CAF4376439.1 unnamed protein product [Didymodactylos carnosus]